MFHYTPHESNMFDLLEAGTYAMPTPLEPTGGETVSPMNGRMRGGARDIVNGVGGGVVNRADMSGATGRENMDRGDGGVGGEAVWKESSEDDSRMMSDNRNMSDAGVENSGLDPKVEVGGRVTDVDIGGDYPSTFEEAEEEYEVGDEEADNVDGAGGEDGAEEEDGAVVEEKEEEGDEDEADEDGEEEGDEDEEVEGDEDEEEEVDEDEEEEGDDDEEMGGSYAEEEGDGAEDELGGSPSTGMGGGGRGGAAPETSINIINVGRLGKECARGGKRKRQSEEDVCDEIDYMSSHKKKRSLILFRNNNIKIFYVC